MNCQTFLCHKTNSVLFSLDTHIPQYWVHFPLSFLTPAPWSCTPPPPPHTHTLWSTHSGRLLHARVASYIWSCPCGVACPLLRYRGLRGGRSLHTATAGRRVHHSLKGKRSHSAQWEWSKKHCCLILTKVSCIPVCQPHTWGHSAPHHHKDRFRMKGKVDRAKVTQLLTTTDTHFCEW